MASQFTGTEGAAHDGCIAASRVAGLSHGTGTIGSAVVAALAFNPIETWTEHASAGLIDRLMPRIQPELASDTIDAVA